MEAVLHSIMYALLFAVLYFEVFLLLTFLERHTRAKQAAGKPAGGWPSVTVVIPCYNEERTIVETIRSVLAQQYPQDKLRVFVVDDGSTDGTYAAAVRFEAHPQVRVFRKENGGKHSALNLGIAHADTDLIAGLDADSYIAQNAIAEIVHAFDAPNVMAVTPAIKVDAPRGIITRIQQAEYMFSVFIRRTFSFVNAQFVTPGPLSVFRRSIFAEIGTFREAHNTEDLEMCLRIQSRHYHVANAPTAHVYTHAPRTLSALMRQRVRWTYGYLKNLIAYRFMLFNPAYSCLGLLVLPVTTLMLFGAIFFFGYALFGVGALTASYVSRVQTVGFSLPEAALPEPFFINTDALIMLIYALVLLTGAFIIIGKYLSAERISFQNIAFYLLFYGFLAPIWLSIAVVNTARSRRGSWVAEHESR